MKYERLQAWLLELFVYKNLHSFVMLTSNDLWSRPISLGFLYLAREIFIPNMKSNQVVLLELICQQGIQTLTSIDLQLPLISTSFLSCLQAVFP